MDFVPYLFCASVATIRRENLTAVPSASPWKDAFKDDKVKRVTLSIIFVFSNGGWLYLVRRRGVLPGADTFETLRQVDRKNLHIEAVVCEDDDRGPTRRCSLQEVVECIRYIRPFLHASALRLMTTKLKSEELEDFFSALRGLSFARIYSYNDDRHNDYLRSQLTSGHLRTIHVFRPNRLDKDMQTAIEEFALTMSVTDIDCIHLCSSRAFFEELFESRLETKRKVFRGCFLMDKNDLLSFRTEWQTEISHSRVWWRRDDGVQVEIFHFATLVDGIEYLHCSLDFEQ